jgi:hypothetical protein
VCILSQKKNPKNKTLKKSICLLLVLIIIASCAGILSKKDSLVGDWTLSESSPDDFADTKNSHKKWEMKISKEDSLYKVDFIIDGKSMYKGMQTIMEYYKPITKNQLSPDKTLLINVVEPSSILMFNKDNNTIITPFGWFKKE